MTLEKSYKQTIKTNKQASKQTNKREPKNKSMFMWFDNSLDPHIAWDKIGRAHV